MLFQRIKRSDPEKVFIVAYNSSATATADGYAVIWDFKTDGDGVGFVIPTARATNGGFAICGLAAETIAASAYGLIQVWGYHSNAMVRSMTGGSPAIAKGRPLALASAGGNMLESYATGSAVIAVQNCGFALAASAVWTTARIAVFIKAL